MQTKCPTCGRPFKAKAKPAKRFELTDLSVERLQRDIDILERFRYRKDANVIRSFSIVDPQGSHEGLLNACVEEQARLRKAIDTKQSAS